MIERYNGQHVSANEIKKMRLGGLDSLFEEDYLLLSAQASVDNIKCLTRHINAIQKRVKDVLKIRKPFQHLMTVPELVRF